MESTPDYTGASAPIEETWLVEIYHESLAKLIFVCLKRTGHQTIAKEIAYESFARLCETVRNEPGKFEDKLFMTQYLYGIANNACTDHWRRSKNNKEHASDFTEHEVVDETLLVLLLEQQDTLARVKALVAMLPPALQEVISLFYIEGKSIKEIAQYLGRSKESIRVDKTRGLNKLRELVKGKEQTISPDVALVILFWISTTA